MSPPPETEPAPAIQAAGAVLWRRHGGRLEVSLVHRPRYKDWSFPKGKLEPGESLPAAAVREVAEETGTKAVLGVPLPAVRYRTADGLKYVHYWTARVATETDAGALRARLPVAKAGRDEIDDVIWVSLPTATELLTRRSDRQTLAIMEQLSRQRRLATQVLVVARHGRARRRSAWAGEETDRPLTDQGRQQAKALVGVLAAFGVREVVTSSWERCLQTVAPYAERARLRVHAMEAMTEAAYLRDPIATMELLTGLLVAPRDAVVVTHRPVLPDLMKTIRDATRSWTRGRIPDADPFLRTGEALVAHVTGAGGVARVEAVELHRPRPAGSDQPRNKESSR